MSTKLYVWLPTALPNGVKLTEHASLELSDGSYISWTFDKSDGARADDILQQGFRDDVEREQRKPDKTFVVKHGKIDEEVVRAWWRKWWRDEIWRKQMPVCPIYTVFEAVTIGHKGFGASEDKGILIRNTHLIDHVKRNKLVITNQKCSIL